MERKEIKRTLNEVCLWVPPHLLGRDSVVGHL